MTIISGYIASSSVLSKLKLNLIDCNRAAAVVNQMPREWLWTRLCSLWLSLGDVQIEENVLLAPFTTLKIGGPARYFVRARTESDITGAVRYARKLKLPLFVLGGGSNLVVPDSGFDGMVLQVALDQWIHSHKLQIEGKDRIAYVADAGVDWDLLVKLVCKAGLSGMECLAGIPGTVGGAPVQNIGAYGQEVASTIDFVQAVDRENGNVVDLHGIDCGFAYRSSIFNTRLKNRYVILKVGFALERTARRKLTYPDLLKHFGGDAVPTPLEVYEAVRTIRAGKGMVLGAGYEGPDSRSAGSFFKNPVVKARVLKDIAETLTASDGEVPHWPAPEGKVKLAAAWLIERAGFPRGFVLGRVGISSKHTLALINRTGDASCADLLQLRDLIALTVEQRFGVALEQEPVMLG
jgi:UDP-N-acetylmuramate dehydrogenase